MAWTLIYCLKKIQAIALGFYGKFSLLQKLEVLMFLEYTSVACRLFQVGERTGGSSSYVIQPRFFPENGGRIEQQEKEL